MSQIINHEEALQLAHLKKETSNLARCYIEICDKLKEVAHSASDNTPMDEIAWVEEAFNCEIMESFADDTIAELNRRRNAVVAQLRHSRIVINRNR